MNRVNTIQLFADYNRWMNQRVYAAAAQLPESELTADRKAFFGSILGTLNHLAVADTIWLKRFLEHPAKYSALDAVRDFPWPTSLDQILFADFKKLGSYREQIDETISEWSKELSEADLDHSLEYKNMKGVGTKKNFFGVLMHLFNHQTHHRGQVTTLLTQAGVDVGATDLLLLVQNEDV
jgi:uncharacterized damage-inducible protein DinB